MPQPLSPIASPWPGIDEGQSVEAVRLGQRTSRRQRWNRVSLRCRTGGADGRAWQRWNSWTNSSKSGLG